MSAHYLDESCHPLLAEWFTARFGQPTDVQQQAWEAIGRGEHALIAAPTGSGKTLAAMLPCLDRIVKGKLRSETPAASRKTKLVYITPLKALNNDIYDHLLHFVEELDAHAKRSGERNWPGISGAVRTGDTTSSKRASMLRRPPDVLVTTPESLYILLTSAKGRTMLESVEMVIVDEIHDLAPDKRGSHLSVSLERLEKLADRSIQRIGVSATQKPLPRVAAFLGGWEPPADNGASGADSKSPAGLTGSDAAEKSAAGTGPHASGTKQAESGAPIHPFGYIPRPVTIVESVMDKQLQVRVTMPDFSQPMKSRAAVWVPIMERLFALMEGCRSVLIFVNSRRLSERVCLHLNDHAGYEIARAHHGSMAKEIRLDVEQKLKAGELRCLVATSSLELGIDVGYVDLVIQLDSPLEAAAGIQRIGRAGHAVGAASRGYIVARNRGALAEIAVLRKQIAERDIEPIVVPRNRIDVLSQQVVSIVASGDMPIGELYRLLLQSDSYRGFPYSRLEEMMKVLAGFYPFARPLLHWNRESGMLSPRSNSSIAAWTGAGTIPTTSAYPVHHAESRARLGELDEEYVQESRVGDVFQLGTHSWMITRIDKERVYVTETANRFSEIPFWRNEGIGRSYALGVRIGAFYRELSGRLEPYDSQEPALASGQGWAAAEQQELAEDKRKLSGIYDWLGGEYGLDDQAAQSLLSLVRSQRRFSEMPTDRKMIVEYYKDVMNQTHVIVHNTFGKRVNRTWLLAIERQMEQLLPYKAYGNAKDNGIEFVLPEWDVSWLSVIGHVTPANLDELLAEAIAGSPMLAIAFRHIAETSLLLSCSFTRTPLWQQRLRSEELLQGALPYAEQFPYLKSAMDDSLHQFLDAEHLKQLLQAVQDGRVEVIIRETEYPSPLASQFLADYVNSRIYEGDGLDPSTQMQLMNVSKELAGELFGKDALRSAVPESVLAEEERRIGTASFPVKAAADMLKLLKQRGDMSLAEALRLAGPAAADWLSRLEAEGEAVSIPLGEGGPAAETRWICGDEREVYHSFPEKETSASFIVARFAEHRLSYTDVDLCERYPQLSLEQSRRITDRLREQGLVEQAPFASDPQERIWTGKQAAARMVRLSMNEARKLAEPLPPIRWCAQFARNQHVLQGTQLKGEAGLRAVLDTMQGIFLPLPLWETVILPFRVLDYRPADLDLLCATGEILWLGAKQPGDKEGKVAFFLADNRLLYEPYIRSSASRDCPHPELLKLLQEGGASFLTKLSREMDQAPSDVLALLMDLVWEGAVSNDQFAPLRLWTGKKGKEWARSGSGQGRWYWTGSLVPGLEGKQDGGREPLRKDGPAGTDGTSGKAGGLSPAVPSGPSGIRDGASGPGASGASGTPESSALLWLKHLLQTYGIVTKELAAQLTPFSWEQLVPLLRRLEEWGTVTRGRFMEGQAGMQFTTPELARAMKEAAEESGGQTTLLSAADPANPFGLLADWPEAEDCTFARKPGNYIILQEGRWSYWIENNGKRIFTMDGNRPDVPASGEALQQLTALLGRMMRLQQMKKLVIDSWNGVPVTETPAGEQLRALGAEADRKSLVFWPSRLL
ncbi:DEAD/DEAH box helicase [Paenibacillus protaetiae]|uniref:DEAD/DEAH box helicase n=1 Tax=Paenibacillus protaetiae TaxID=2509456 RepID=A0A4P6ETL7_9BACL|nr:DEAD/DEAH box helicase [Paenibacillus protaetiae]QAY65986.1 DEAD/DEAH box helicase [Paenibacillus protaetiae]